MKEGITFRHVLKLHEANQKERRKDINVLKQRRNKRGIREIERHKKDKVTKNRQEYIIYQNELLHIITYKNRNKQTESQIKKIIGKI